MNILFRCELIGLTIGGKRCVAFSHMHKESLRVTECNFYYSLEGALLAFKLRITKTSGPADVQEAVYVENFCEHWVNEQSKHLDINKNSSAKSCFNSPKLILRSVRTAVPQTVGCYPLVGHVHSSSINNSLNPQLLSVKHPLQYRSISILQI